MMRDVVVLAAGRGERLRGIAAPFHKPLMIVDGQPLISSAVNAAIDHDPLTRTVTVVAAPDNVSPICELLADHLRTRRVNVVVQPTPRGPGAALLTGLAAVHTEYVLVLAGDNTTHADELSAYAGATTVGFKVVSAEESKRYTCIVGDYVFEDDRERTSDTYRVWCGPLMLPTSETIDHLSYVERATPGVELKLGRHIQPISRKYGSRIRLVPSSARDVGVPEELLA